MRAEALCQATRRHVKECCLLPAYLTHTRAVCSNCCVWWLGARVDSATVSQPFHIAAVDVPCQCWHRYAKMLKSVDAYRKLRLQHSMFGGAPWPDMLVFGIPQSVPWNMYALAIGHDITTCVWPAFRRRCCPCCCIPNTRACHHTHLQMAWGQLQWECRHCCRATPSAASAANTAAASTAAAAAAPPATGLLL